MNLLSRIFRQQQESQILPESSTTEKSPYAKINLYTGIYEIPLDGHIRIPGAKIRILRGSYSPEDEGWSTRKHTEDWLIVEDKNFWPVMIQLTRQDKEYLVKELSK